LDTVEEGKNKKMAHDFTFIASFLGQFAHLFFLRFLFNWDFFGGRDFAIPNKEGFKEFGVRQLADEGFGDSLSFIDVVFLS